MAGLKILGTAVFVLFMTTIACRGQRYTRYPGVQFAPPGSWSVACPSGVRCSSLYCAAQCGAARAKCRSFSYSASNSTCILAGQVFSLSSSFSVYDPQWSAYKQQGEDTPGSDVCSAEPCKHGGTCSPHPLSSTPYLCTCTAGVTGDRCQLVPHHCKDLLDEGLNTNGVYTIYPDDVTPISVYCDQDTDGGGWVVFQRRQDGSENFDRSFSDYKSGFGDLQSEFWLGLDNIQSLTSRWTHVLRVEVGGSRSNAVSAIYTNFRLDGTTYTLRYGAFVGGQAGDCLKDQSNYPFTTPPRYPSAYCAPLYYGAWWFANSCYFCNLNGRYGNTAGGGVKWHTWAHGFSNSWSEMKIRPGV